MITNLRAMVNKHLWQPMTDGEFYEAEPYAYRKYCNYLARSGDYDTKYLAQLIAETVNSNRLSQHLKNKHDNSRRDECGQKEKDAQTRPIPNYTPILQHGG